MIDADVLHLSNGLPLCLTGHDTQEKEGRKDVTDQGASNGTIQPQDKLHCNKHETGLK